MLLSLSWSMLTDDALKELPEEVFDLPHVSEMRVQTEKFFMSSQWQKVMFP